MIAKEIEQFLLEEMAVGAEHQVIDPEADLIEQRMIDSLGILKVVAFLEDAFGIKVLDEDIVPENFKSVSRLASFVEEKRRG